MVKGFKNFLMQGDVVVIAIGLMVALAFSTLIKAIMARRGETVFGEAAPVKTRPACLSDDLPVAATKCKYCGTDQATAAAT